MSLRRVRTSHVYATAAAAFALLLGFEGVRMATGHDPALTAKPAAAATAVPTPEDDGDWGRSDEIPDEMPQPESRLS